jgi:hypothetical protein
MTRASPRDQAEGNGRRLPAEMASQHHLSGRKGYPLCDETGILQVRALPLSAKVVNPVDAGAVSGIEKRAA